MQIVSDLLRDLQLGLRRLRRDAGFTTATVGCLALAIGGVTAVYSVIEPVLWRSLPFPDPDGIHVLQSGFAAAGGGRQLYAYAGENYMVVRDEQAIFEVMGALVPDQFLIGHGDDAVVVAGASAASDVFEVLRIQPIAGRWYTPAEERRGTPAAVISDGLWQRQFGGAPDVIGRRILINGREAVVVGVLPSGAAYPLGTDVWIPMGIDRWSSTDLEIGILTVLTRLRSDVNGATAREALASLDAMLTERYPSRNTDRVSALTPLREFMVGDLRGVMTGLLGAVVFLGLLGAVNVGALLMARGRSTAKELSLRAVLGASRGRMARQLFTETLILCTLGGAVGAVLAWLTLPALLALAPHDLPTFAPVAMGSNGAVLTAGLVLINTLVVGIAPAFGLTRTAVARGREATSSRSVRRTNDFLIGLELAVATVLVAGAALLYLDVRRLVAVDTGVVPRDVVTYRVRLPDEGYTAHERIVTTFDEMLIRVRSLPGVEGVGATHRLPFGDGLMGWSFSVEGQPPDRPGEVEVALGRIVAGDYLNTVRVPIVTGRVFDARDTMRALPVVIVSQALADRYWPGADPIGKRIKRRGYDSDRPWLTVIGVAADVRDRGPGLPPQPVIYRPLAQTAASYANQLTFVVRRGAAGPDLSALRNATGQVEPLARIFDFEPFAVAVDSVTGPSRFAATLLNVFATLGLLLAGAGAFGMTLYVVQHRLPEIGIRRALGATERMVLWETLRHAAAVAVAGVAAGFAAFIALHDAVSAQVSTVHWFEPRAHIPAAVLLVLVAVSAAAIPARRGARIDPVSLIRI